MKTITFYSYKGGVGRTLALSNIATRLAELGKKVFLIDFDFEAPGLPFKFKSFKRQNIKAGLVDYLYQYSIKNNLPDSIKEYTYAIKLGKGAKELTLLPAGDTSSKDYWSHLALINWHEMFYRNDSRGLELFLDLKNKIIKEFNPDFLLIDSRTGITEISGITISIFADEVAIFFANNIEGLDGTARVINAIMSPENNLIKAQPKINLILSRIPYRLKDDDSFLDSAIRTKALTAINNFLVKENQSSPFTELILIHSDRELEIQEKFKIGFSIKTTDKGVINFAPSLSEGDSELSLISQDYLNLFESLTKDVLTSDEIDKFHRIKASQRYVVMSEKADTEGKKIELLNEAVKLNDRNEEAHRQLAIIYFQLGLWENSSKYIDKLLELDSRSINGLYLKAHLLLRTGKFDQSLERFIELFSKYNLAQAAASIIEIYITRGNKDEAYKYAKQYYELDPDSSESLNSYANTLRLLGRYDEAIPYVYKSIEFSPKNPFPYSTLAEINGAKGNDEEFYKNFELSLMFGLPFKRIFVLEDLYAKYISEPRFVNLVKKYGFDTESLVSKTGG